MNDDSELEIDEIGTDDKIPLPKRRQAQSERSKFLPILIGILLVAVFAGGIFYFLNKQSTGSDSGSAESMTATLEQRVTELEKQVSELQAKINAAGPDATFVQRVDLLAQKVDALERRKVPEAESKAKTTAPKKPQVTAEKQVHTVQKGETLQRISKRYGVSIEEIRKLNNLSAGQPLRAGQKLRLSSGH